MELQKLQPPASTGYAIYKALEGAGFYFDVNEVCKELTRLADGLEADYAAGKRPVSADAKRILVTGCPIGGVLEKTVKAIEAATREELGAVIGPAAGEKVYAWFRREPEDAVRKAMRGFACKYGLLGIMTALPTTAKFIDYEKVYFPYNEIVKTESMETLDYLTLFFPFQMPDFKKKGVDSVWNADAADDKYLFPLLMTYRAAPEAMTMSFMRNYGERYDWLVAIIKEWSFMLITEYYYYDDANPADAETRDLYQKGMAAFDGNAPTYHIELREHPIIVWDFHSLLLNIKLMFSFMLTDENKPLRLCRECLKPFIAPRANANFCSPACREKHKNKRSKQ